jgi:hypothetical protein
LFRAKLSFISQTLHNVNYTHRHIMPPKKRKANQIQEDEEKEEGDHGDGVSVAPSGGGEALLVAEESKVEVQHDAAALGLGEQQGEEVAGPMPISKLEVLRFSYSTFYYFQCYHVNVYLTIIGLLGIWYQCSND